MTVDKYEFSSFLDDLKGFRGMLESDLSVLSDSHPRSHPSAQTILQNLLSDFTEILDNHKALTAPERIEDDVSLSLEDFLALEEKAPRFLTAAYSDPARMITAGQTYMVLSMTRDFSTDGETKLSVTTDSHYGYSCSVSVREAASMFERASGDEIKVGRWCARFVRPGAFEPGRDLINDSSKAHVSFYDISQDKEKFPMGQFVACYYVDTLLGKDGYGEDLRKTGTSLRLYADIPEWTVKAFDMRVISNWLGMKQEEPARESTAEKAEPSLESRITGAKTRAGRIKTNKKELTAIRDGNKFQLYPSELLSDIALRHAGGRVEVDGVVYDLQTPLSMTDCIKFDEIPYAPKKRMIDQFLTSEDRKMKNYMRSGRD